LVSLACLYIFFCRTITMERTFINNNTMLAGLRNAKRSIVIDINGQCV